MSERCGVDDCRISGGNAGKTWSELEADLAAAVAELDQWCRRAKLSEAKEALAEARLAAIDAAPTVAYVNSLSQAAPNYLIAELLPPQDRPPLGTDLIARPAKDAP